ncbi:unnamed protein product [Penicillium viridicatum]
MRFKDLSTTILMLWLDQSMQRPMGYGAAMVNTPDQSAHEIVLEMVTRGFTLLRDAGQYVNQTSKL